MGPILDSVFLITLFVLLPIYTFCRHHVFSKIGEEDSKNNQDEKTFSALHRTCLVALLLLVLLGSAWVSNGRGFSDLGLGVPGNRGIVSLTIIAIVPVILTVVVRMLPSKASATDTEDHIFLSSSKEEFLRKIPLITFISAAWEIIYRGALMFYFTPYLGVVISMIAAAAFYAFIHKAKNPKRYIATFLSAIFFLGIFVLSGSLWGAIVLHCMIPIIGGFAALSIQDKST